jgi:neutral trehalase
MMLNVTTNSCTLQVIPADLNAWLMLLARDIATIARWLGATAVAEAAARSEALRRAALNELAWSQQQVYHHQLELITGTAAVTLLMVPVLQCW